MSEETRLYYKLTLSLVICVVGLVIGMAGVTILVLAQESQWELYGAIVILLSIPFFGYHRAMMVDGYWRKYHEWRGEDFDHKPLGEWKDEMDKELGYE